MKVWIASVVFLAFAPALAAQSAPEASPASKSRAQGYTLFGLATPVGDAGNVMTLGGGGEGFIYKGLAAGGDMNYLFTGGRFTYGLGLASANLSYHFRGLDANGQWVPFVTGGCTLAFRDGTAGMANYGGGVTYWFRPHWGARVEVRGLQRTGRRDCVGPLWAFVPVDAAVRSAADEDRLPIHDRTYGVQDGESHPMHDLTYGSDEAVRSSAGEGRSPSEG